MITLLNSGGTVRNEPQTDGSMSLGGPYSSTPLDGLHVTRAAIQIRFLNVISANSNHGVGTIRVTATNTVTWEPPVYVGGSATPTLIPTANTTVVVPYMLGGAMVSWIEVQRSDTVSPSPTPSEQIGLEWGQQNAVAGYEYLPDEAGYSYSCLMIRNTGSTVCDAVRVIPGANMVVGVKPQDDTDRLPDHLTAPPGITFTWPSGGITFNPTGWLGIWIRKAFDAEGEGLTLEGQITFTEASVPKVLHFGGRTSRLRLGTAPLVRPYHTGSAHDGDPQGNPMGCTGGYRSDTLAQVGMAFRGPNPLWGLDVISVDAAAGTGFGYIEASIVDSAQYLAWRAPGEDEYGPAVAAPVGSIIRLPSLTSGATAGAGGIVVQISELPPRSGQLAGSLLNAVERIELRDVACNAVGLEPYTLADGYTYSAVALVNDAQHGGAVTGCAFDLTGADGVDIAVVEPVDNAIVSWDSVYHAPAGVTFGATPPTGGYTIPAGGWLGLIIRTHHTDPTPRRRIRITGTGNLYGYGPVRLDVAGIAMRGKSTTCADLLYIGVDEEPDYDAAPADTGAQGDDLTYTAPADDHILYVEVLRRNAFGLISPSFGAELVRVTDGLQAILPPPPPTYTTIRAVPGGVISVLSAYRRGVEPGTNEPTSFALWRAVGEDPDPTETPTYTQLAGAGTLNWTDPTTYAPGTDVRVIVRMRREWLDTEDPPVAHHEDSTNTDVHSALALASPPSMRKPVAAGGTAGYGMQSYAVSDEPGPWPIDVDNDLEWRVTSGGIGLFVGDVRLLTLSASGSTPGIISPLEIINGAVSGSASALIECGQWDSEAKIVYIAADGEYRIAIDAVAMTMTCAGISNDMPHGFSGPGACVAGANYTQLNGRTAGGAWLPVAEISSDGILHVVGITKE